MAKIYIGSEYGKTFDSVVKLYRENCIKEGSVLSADADRIVTPSHEFILARGAAARDDGSFNAVMGDNGASWFGMFRGESVKNDTAEWLMFVESVKEHFHRNYSIVEYSPRRHVISNELIESHCALINNVLSSFFDNYVFDIRRGDESESLEDVYGASLRLEITDGTGEAVPVLGKVFFRKVGKKILPYGKEEAEVINSYLSTFDSEREEDELMQNSAELTDIVVNALDKLVYPDGNSQGADLSDYVVLADGRDENAVGIMVEKGPNDNVDLTCLNLSLLNVLHFQWRKDNYDVRLDGKVALKAILGIGGRLSLYCNSCRKKSTLIEFNKIKYVFDGVEKTALINPAHQGLGLSEEILRQIKSGGTFTSHLLRISCSENARLAGRCVKYVCEDDTAVLDGGVRKCKRCPHPEVVYVCEDGIARYTKNLAFVRDRMTLVPKDKIARCSCCGRSFYSETNSTDYVCDFCKITKLGIDAIDDAEYKQGNKLYRKYSGMLSLVKRIGSLNKKKYCKEDEDCIMFMIDESVLIFNKDTAKSSGYLSAPKGNSDKEAAK